MNPIAKIAPNSGVSAVPDVTPPAQRLASKPPLSSPVQSAGNGSMRTEIVANIPVKAPATMAAVSRPQKIQNPMGATQTLSDPTGAKDDKELDQILKDVNQKVRVSSNSLDEQFDHLTGVRKKMAIKKAKLDQKHQGSPPIAATVIACTVALILTASAFKIIK